MHTKLNILLLMALFLFACNASKKGTKTTEETVSAEAVKAEEVIPTTETNAIEEGKPVIEFSKSACYGRCPAYTMRVYPDGKLEYDGKRFTDRVGLHTKQITKEACETLVNACRNASLWELEEAYGMRVMDLPTVTLNFSDMGKSRTVKWKIHYPEVLKELGKQLTEVADSEGWEKVTKE